MKDSSNLHLKVQEFCDCYATSSPLKEMSDLGEDTQEAALKWLALTVLHGINNNAEKISISLSDEGEIEVTAKYRNAHLPAPNSETAEKIFEVMRQLTHIEGKKGKTLLALGIRDSSLELNIKLKKKDNENKLTIAFPD